MTEMGLLEEAKGKVKEAAGDITDNNSLKVEGEAQASKGAEERKETQARTEDMVACARCGVHLPRSEAREERGAFYCRDNPRCLESR